jgi:hypothetical protein
MIYDTILSRWLVQISSRTALLPARRPVYGTLLPVPKNDFSSAILEAPLYRDAIILTRLDGPIIYHSGNRVRLVRSRLNYLISDADLLSTFVFIEL